VSREARRQQEKIEKTLGFLIAQRVHTGVATNHPPKENQMAALITTRKVEPNYDRFIVELTELTRKYGVAIKSVGGVILANSAGEFCNVTYDADIASGDLYPRFDD
jgi:hypothetical protein